MIDRRSFVRMVGNALAGGRGFAAGKLGGSERWALLYPLVKAEVEGQGRQRALDVMMGHMGETQSGLFPRDPDFYRRFSAFFTAKVAQLDAIGLFGWKGEERVLEDYRFAGERMRFLDQEPDRSIPDRTDRCYLPFFHGRRLLLVSPFAPLLVERANEATFEAVWARTGKRWFHPAAVDGLAMPYGWDAETQARHADSIALFEALRAEMEGRDFDVALISAGGLGIPLAAAAKAMGKAAISLGGHLQVLFGVAGRRWREEQPEWRDHYFNDAWINPPEDYRPTRPTLLEGGAYW
jgi:hypothetical protein